MSDLALPTRRDSTSQRRDRGAHPVHVRGAGHGALHVDDGGGGGGVEEVEPFGSGGQDLLTVPQEADERQHHADVVGAVAAQDVGDELDVVAERAARHHDPPPAAGPFEDLGAERPHREVAVDHAEVLDRLHRGVGVVDRCRQRLAGDVGLLPDAEPDVLLDRALETDTDVLEDRLLEHRCAGPWFAG